MKSSINYIIVVAVAVVVAVVVVVVLRLGRPNSRAHHMMLNAFKLCFVQQREKKRIRVCVLVHTFECVCVRACACVCVCECLQDKGRRADSSMCRGRIIKSSHV